MLLCSMTNEVGQRCRDPKFRVVMETAIGMARQKFAPVVSARAEYTTDPKTGERYIGIEVTSESPTAASLAALYRFMDAWIDAVGNHASEVIVNPKMLVGA